MLFILRPTVWICGLLLLGSPLVSRAVNWRKESLPARMPRLVAKLAPLGRLPATNLLHLTFGLPLRNEAALDALIRQIYDPSSPKYHHFLTPQEFTAQFGPTKADYATLLNFARTNGFVVTGTQPNRMLVNVVGTVKTAERVFNVTLHTYRHPHETRDFYAPNQTPTVITPVPLLNVSGLNNYSLPHPNFVPMTNRLISAVSPRLGSVTLGGYAGNDFRNAYVPGTTLTGAGQSVALVQFDGYYSNDISSYINQADIHTSVVLTNVPVNGGVNVTNITSTGSEEVSLDIEMIISMAPGLNKLYVYEAPPTTSWPTILSQIANDDLANQISCSWGGGGPDPTSEQIFKQMAAQGQSFFNASGDSDAFTGAVPFPSDSTNITQVGGTTLTTTGTNATYVSESTWNWGGGTGSSGGVSTYYRIPYWQTGISMASNGGSTTYRDIPDVALTADNVYVTYNNGSSGLVGGTSCAAPLWAGFMALVNEQASANDCPPVGFVNPAIYSLANSSEYTNCFHDITTGNNFDSASPSLYSATKGYDLCTGLGTPNGMNLINYLADPLGITPVDGFTATSVATGNFTNAARTYTLRNYGRTSLDWGVGNPVGWLNVSPVGGTLLAGLATNVTVAVNSAASSLAVGTYYGLVVISNLTTQVAQPHRFTLQVLPPLAFSPASNLVFNTSVGGTSALVAQNIALTNSGLAMVDWSLINTSTWLTVSSTNGTLAPGEQIALTANPQALVSVLPAGTYSTTLVLTNAAGWSIEKPFVLQVNSLVQNGGFETGDFTDWTLNANGINVITNEADLVHSGTYGFGIGQYGSLGYLSQNIPTTPGQNYVLSFWLDNPPNSIGATPNQFQVQWNGSNIFNRANIPATSWTNLQFSVVAAGTNSVLQFGFFDDPFFLGLDDVSLTPMASPAFAVTQNTGSTFDLSWHTSPGLIYQIQYTTNLVHPDWINLGGSFITTNSSLNLSDTNVPGSPAQRFYRLQVVQ